MKKLYLLFYLLSAFTFDSVAQDWKWDTLINDEINIQLTKDDFHNIYSCSYGSSELRKHDQSGTLIWQKNLPQNLEITKVVCSKDSTIFIIGTFQNTVTVGTSTISSHGSSDIFIARLTSVGNLVWLTSFGSKGADRAGDICMNDTNIVITGSTFDTLMISSASFPRPQKDELFVAKFFANGNLDQVMLAFPGNWSLYNLDISSGYEIERDGQGSFVLLVGIMGNIQIDTANLNGGAKQGVEGDYIIKLDSSLKFLWMSGPNPNLEDYHCVRINSQNEIFFTRELHYNVPGNYGYIQKLDASGNLISSSFLQNYAPSLHYAAFGIWDLTIDSCDNLYFIGAAARLVTLTNKWKWYLKLGQASPSGNINWIRSDSSYNTVWGTTVIQLSPNNLVVGGFFFDSLKLKDIMIASNTYTTYQGHNLGLFIAGLKTTIGIPTNATPKINELVCLGNAATLVAQSAGFISWFSNALATTPLSYGSTFTTSPLTSGVHTFYAEASTCTLTTGRAPFTFTVLPTPTVTVNDGSICDKESFTINPSGAISYTFSGGSSVVTPSVSKIYTVTGMATNNCTAVALSHVTVNPLPKIKLSSGYNFSCIGETVTLTCSGATSYTWNTGSNATFLVTSPVAPVSYTIEGISAEGCYNKITHLHAVAPCLDLSEVKGTTFEIYPNPAQGDFLIITPSVGELFIYNLCGQLLEKKPIIAGHNRISITEHPAGVYLCACRFPDGTTVSKRLVRQ